MEIGQSKGADCVKSVDRVSSRPHSGGRYKRFLDLAVLISAHVLLLPVFLALWVIVPLAIWLEDKGPIFYVQQRVGKGGRVFRLFKFRSMRMNAELGTGPVWAIEEDPRITRVGRFLRARALDELPQVVNIFKGDLSFVGPRPERPELAEEFEAEIPCFRNRLQVPPGLTGLAQVHGGYATKPRQKLRYDLLYLNTMSPWLDIKILFLSLLATIRARWQEEVR